jgi:hypothetical protein
MSSARHVGWRQTASHSRRRRPWCRRTIVRNLSHVVVFRISSRPCPSLSPHPPLDAGGGGNSSSSSSNIDDGGCDLRWRPLRRSQHTARARLCRRRRRGRVRRRDGSRRCRTNSRCASPPIRRRDELWYNTTGKNTASGSAVSRLHAPHK